MGAETKNRMRQPHASRTAEARAAYPLDSEVTTTVHAIGGRSEKVTGTVSDHRPGAVVVKTACHGRIVVPLGKIEPPC